MDIEIGSDRPEATRSLGRGRRLAGWLVAALALGLTAQPRAWAQTAAQTGYRLQSASQLDRLVAPIALYPDSLVAQILAAATFPAEVVEADRWLRSNAGLDADASARAVDRQPWDGSVKALTAFPSVLGNMDRNLSWTAALGEAYYAQPQDVMAAVQRMRARAQDAGNLVSGSEEVVMAVGPDLVIEPLIPDVVAVPQYDPWLVYGTPLAAWPGWYEYPGVWLAGQSVAFAAGLSVGFAAGYAWGWYHWRCNWRHHFVSFNHEPYAARNVTLFDHRDLRGRIVRPFAAGAASRAGVGAHVVGRRGGRTFRVGRGARPSRGYRLGSRYRVGPGNAAGRGYPLHASRGFRLTPRDRFWRSLAPHGYRLPGGYRAPRPALVGRPGVVMPRVIARPGPRVMAPAGLVRPAVAGAQAPAVLAPASPPH